MKIRNGFVSNSSSSSFIIEIEKITETQLKQIKSHRVISKRFNLNCNDDDEWEIHIRDTYVIGFTYMDNFRMELFLEAIGVKPEDIEWYDKYGNAIQLLNQ